MRLESAFCDIFLILAAQQENAAEQTAEDQYANAHTGGGLVGLHLLQSHDAEDQGKDHEEAGDHTDDDKYLSESFHSSLLKMIIQTL